MDSSFFWGHSVYEKMTSEIQIDLFEDKFMDFVPYFHSYCII
jgi:hypothetical protein